VEARARVGAGRVGLVREGDRRRRGLVDGAVVRQRGGWVDVVDVHGGRVFREAAVLVDDPRLDGVIGRAVVVGAAGRGRGPGAGGGGRGEVVVGAAVVVAEAGGGVVGGRRVLV